MLDGIAVGSALGLPVGLTEGVAVGMLVGFTLGLLDGEPVGLLVHTSLTHCPELLLSHSQQSNTSQ